MKPFFIVMGFIDHSETHFARQTKTLPQYRKHETIDSAQAEAARLAMANPKMKFAVVQVLEVHGANPS